jgi:hypothetical protein
VEPDSLATGVIPLANGGAESRALLVTVAAGLFRSFVGQLLE